MIEMYIHRTFTLMCLTVLRKFIIWISQAKQKKQYSLSFNNSSTIFDSFLDESPCFCNMKMSKYSPEEHWKTTKFGFFTNWGFIISEISSYLEKSLWELWDTALQYSVARVFSSKPQDFVLFSENPPILRVSLITLKPAIFVFFNFSPVNRVWNPPNLQQLARSGNSAAVHTFIQELRLCVCVCTTSP